MAEWIREWVEQSPYGAALGVQAEEVREDGATLSVNGGSVMAG